MKEEQDIEINDNIDNNINVPNLIQEVCHDQSLEIQTQFHVLVLEPLSQIFVTRKSTRHDGSKLKLCYIN